MQLSFFETMRGDLRDREGRTHRAEFEIKAETGRLRSLLATGRTRLTGVVHAPPFAIDAPLEGTLRISPLLRREIEYRFRFADEQGEEYELVGVKSLRLTRPLSSATTMRVSLHYRGDEIASGTMHFDPREIADFAASWAPSSSLRSVSTRPVNPDDTVLSEAERRIFDAFNVALFVPGELVPPPSTKVVDTALARLAEGPAHALPLYRAALRWLDTVSRVRKGKGFAALPAYEATELLDELSAVDGGGLSKMLPARLVVFMLSSVLKNVHFHTDEYLDALGHPRPQPVAAEPEPRFMQRVTTAEELEADTTLEAEVVVVGTGAGGAALAARLAEQGVAVLMIEEGRYEKRVDFGGDLADRMARMYRFGGMNFTVGSLIAIPTGRVVGGTTTINSGTCLRTPDRVLDEWRSVLRFPDDFAPDRFGEYLDIVADELQVGPAQREVLGKTADRIAEGCASLGLDHGPLPRNAPGCMGAGVCVFGCPEGAKRSTDVSFVPRALRAGAALVTGLPVTRILRRGERVVALEARGSDRNGAPRRLRVKADHFVLSCGTLNTPLILADNGIDLPMLGRNLSCHPGHGLYGRFAESLEPWNAIPQGYAIWEHQEHGVAYEGYYMPPAWLSVGLPWVGKELTEWMDDFARIAQFGFMVKDDGVGTVRRGPNGTPLITYRLTKSARRRLTEGTSLVAKVMLKAGAREVFTGIASEPMVRTMAEADALRDRDFGHLDFNLLGSHPLGTCRMGATPGNAVVDFDYRVFGTENLYVVDGGTVPTSLGVNPQMTIMAFALRAADQLAANYG